MPSFTGLFCYGFDHVHDRPPRELADLLGGKGANLAEMTSVLGIPVPPGFTITTEACRAALTGGWPAGLDDEIEAHLARLEARMERRLGDPDDPLLVSVRSGARASMPGMLDTVLNLGLAPATVEGLARRTDARFAYDSLRRFISMYARIVLEADAAPLDALVAAAVAEAGAGEPGGLAGDRQRDLCSDMLAALAAQGAPIPADPRLQLRQAIEAVFRSWTGKRARSYRAKEGIAEDLGTAVNVQAMVFGNRDARSGTGVAFTRDAATGDPNPYGDFLPRAQGEDVVAGVRKTRSLDAMAELMPELHRQLLDILTRLEAHYRDMCDTEFTVESGKLWMLQTRVGKRTARAALRMAVDMARQDGWRISRGEAIARVRPDLLDQLQFPSLATGGAALIARGLPASPGVAIGRVYVSADACLDAVDRDEDVVLVRAETSPDDVHGMQVAQGVLTSRGGLVSHAAVVARGWNIPAVVGAEAVEIGDTGFTVGPLLVREGEDVSIDGASGEVYLGRLEVIPGGPPPELAVLLEWAAELTGAPPTAREDPKTLLEQARAKLEQTQAT